MVKEMHYQIDRASWESIAHTDFYNPPQALFVNGKQKAFLSHGADDSVQIYVEDTQIVIVSENSRMGYAGMEKINRETFEQEFSILAQGEDYENDNLADMSWDEIRDHLEQWDYGD